MAAEIFAPSGVRLPERQRHSDSGPKSEYQLRYARPFVHMEQLGSHWTDFDQI